MDHAAAAVLLLLLEVMRKMRTMGKQQVGFRL
jgi:hypothetical protein